MRQPRLFCEYDTRHDLLCMCSVLCIDSWSTKNTNDADTDNDDEAAIGWTGLATRNGPYGFASDVEEGCMDVESLRMEEVTKRRGGK